jgi:hypothetical protein
MYAIYLHKFNKQTYSISSCYGFQDLTFLSGLITLSFPLVMFTQKIILVFFVAFAPGGLQRDVALVYEPKCGERGGVAGSQPMSAAVLHRSPK